MSKIVRNIMSAPATRSWRSPVGHCACCAFNAKAEFATIRERLLKIGARVIEHVARIRVHLPTSCPERALFRVVALNLMPAVP
jgi:hypothetical protein